MTEMNVGDIVANVRAHRCYSHPVFQHWTSNAPSTEVIGALFHQIRNFCDATRPGHNLPIALKELGLSTGSGKVQEIVESEEDHGPQLAAMAGHIMNRSSGHAVCPDVFDQTAVESKLKDCSDKVLGSLPGYDRKTGLMPQTKKAIAVFDGRQKLDEETVYKNLGTTLALEIISHRQLIPGEKHCLVDSGLYETNLEEPEMFYLKEHFGETGAEGAEAMHEERAIEALVSVLKPSNMHLVQEGANDFLDSLVAIWDLLDVALLESGATRTYRAAI